MKRPLLFNRWNHAEHCPGPNPWAHGVWFMAAWPFGVAWIMYDTGYDLDLARTIWACWYWWDWSKPT